MVYHLANGSQLHVRFLSGPCLSLLRPTLIKFHWRPAHGDLRAQKKKKHRWHCICFQEATSFSCFAMIGNGRVNRLLGTRRKVKNPSEEAPHCIERCFHSRHGGSFAPSVRLDKGQLTNASGAHLTVESYDSEGLVLRPLEKRGNTTVIDGGFPKSKKRCQIKPETHTSQSFLAGDAPYLVPGQSLEKSSIAKRPKQNAFQSCSDSISTDVFWKDHEKRPLARSFVVEQILNLFFWPPQALKVVP